MAGIAAALALAAGALTAPSSAAGAPQAAPGDFAPCPAALPVADVTVGMTGTGLTVVRGTEPQEFAVEVLGVLRNGVGPGRDMIVVEVSDVVGGNVINQAGGIWAGMSGSPVYVNGQLLGSVSYGFSWATSTIGGITPAADMLDLLDLGAAAGRADAGAEKVTLPASLRKKIAATTDASAPRGSMRRLPVPLAMSGLSTARVNQFQKDADAADLPVIAYNGSGAAAPAAEEPMVAPVAGGNFVAALATGDVSAYATGTTTAVCGGQALAFGHPFQIGGPVSYGANVGTSMAIIRDEASGSFKLAAIGAPIGTVDQDRFAGLRAKLGAVPASTEITTQIRNADTGRERTGTTNVLARDWLPSMAVYGTWGGYDAVFDEWADGRASSSWVITGTRAGGRPFIVYRANRWSSRYDVTVEPAFDLAYALDALTSTDLEPVTITDVDFDSNVSTTYRQSRITKVEVSVNGGKYRSPEVLRVKAGAKLKVRTTLKGFRSTSSTTRTTSLSVPAKARGQFGYLSVEGGLGQDGDDGEESEGCLLDPETCEESEGTLDAVIARIEKAPRNDDVVTRFVLASPRSGKVSLSKKITRRESSTVSGGDGFEIAVR